MNRIAAFFRRLRDRVAAAHHCPHDDPHCTPWRDCWECWVDHEG